MQVGVAVEQPAHDRRRAVPGVGPDEGGFRRRLDRPLQLVGVGPLLVDGDRSAVPTGQAIGLDQGRVVGRHLIGRPDRVAAVRAKLEGRMAADDLAQPAHEAAGQ